MLRSATSAYSDYSALKMIYTAPTCVEIGAFRCRRLAHATGIDLSVICVWRACVSMRKVGGHAGWRRRTEYSVDRCVGVRQTPATTCSGRSPDHGQLRLRAEPMAGLTGTALIRAVEIKWDARLYRLEWRR